MSDRSFQMRRLGPGDYLLPANSVRTTDRYYRITKWSEAPPVVPKARVVWSLFVAHGYDLDHLSLTLAPWSMPEWSEVGEFDTRQEAIEYALKHDEVAEQ